jgi:RNA polymerase sigma-70 factor, ECF subfamily
LEEFNEELILARAVTGDGEAFGQLYEQYVGRIYNYVYYRTGSVFDAEDLTERVFMRALKHIRNYKMRGLPFSAWLYRIAHNLVANWHRDNSRRKDVALDEGYIPSQPSTHPEFELMRLEEQDNLLRVIRQLSPDRQQVLILKFVDHLSNAEIGQVMGRTEGAVKSLYHRTLLAIRDEYQDFSIEQSKTEGNDGKE